MKLKTTGRSQVDEVPYGTYVFRCADGQYMGDGDGRLMCILGVKNDRAKIRQLVDAAKHYDREAAFGGEVEFWSGQRPITDEEAQEQETRSRLGLIPDPLDYGAHKDELKRKQND